MSATNINSCSSLVNSPTRQFWPSRAELCVSSPVFDCEGRSLFLRRFPSSNWKTIDYHSCEISVTETSEKYDKLFLFIFIVEAISLLFCLVFLCYFSFLSSSSFNPSFGNFFSVGFTFIGLFISSLQIFTDLVLWTSRRVQISSVFQYAYPTSHYCWHKPCAIQSVNCQCHYVNVIVSMWFCYRPINVM